MNKTKLCKKCNKNKPLIDFASGSYYRCKSCTRIYNLKYRKDNITHITTIGKKYQQSHMKKILVYNSQRKKLARIKVINYYTDNNPHCQCPSGKCKETNIGFLTIDHINNDGAEHKRKIGGGDNLCLWIIRNNYPSNLRVLCYNCNCARGKNGGDHRCPHELIL